MSYCTTAPQMAQYLAEHLPKQYKTMKKRPFQYYSTLGNNKQKLAHTVEYNLGGSTNAL